MLCGQSPTGKYTTAINKDYIDNMFPYREGILIIYCDKCGLSKNYVESLIKPKRKLI